jgi:uroporphyrinogen III methyltransferase/synthase
VKRGRVILVGAGPGSPELITVRGAKALREADAVVYDALASPDLLALAPPGAQRIDVGKRGHEAPTMAQEDTNALLLRLAARGLTVVRLKGGDPFVFGRGGEEASACVEAGIPIEVVPGVSSIFGALAYAGIPITDRRYGASFAVVTGHKDPTKVTEETRWDLLANAADTLSTAFSPRVARRRRPRRW